MALVDSAPLHLTWDWERRFAVDHSASLEKPDAIAPVSRTLDYAKDLTVDLDPYTVAVVEIRAE